MPDNFNEIFAQLRAILQKHTGRLTVAADTPTRFCLECTPGPKLTGPKLKRKGPMPLAWVQIDKNYVSYHLMPVYGCPQLLDRFSAKLRARMQGKSCFNFTKVDAGLFQELDQLTGESFNAFKRGGFMPA